MPHPVQTPQLKSQSHSRSRNSPSQKSPIPSSTSGAVTKSSVVKALPTVRDHTTDQLNPEGDEYIPRETDPDGEEKVTADGYVLDNRKYRCRTFKVPNRGEKLFMLATECARVLGYRDSYLLFNKNRSLFKIIASQPEKDNLIQQEILPYSYRSRQIAIVTARSMFRQFGARLIENGHRVRDDYWQAKAIKQGFTEEDAAGEKRPGATRAREAAAAEASQATITSIPQNQIVYSNGPELEGHAPPMDSASLAPLPMIHIPGDDVRPSNYGHVARPRQEVAGPAFQDRTQPSSAGDIMAQAAQAAEYNKQLSQTRGHRSSYLDDYWRRQHEQPAIETTSEPVATSVAPATLQSPQPISHLTQPRMPSESLPHASSQMIPPPYSAYANPQNPMASPVQSMHRSLPPAPMHQGSPTMNMSSGASHRQTPSYGNYQPPSQMWQQPPPQPQPSPLSQSHHVLPQYGQQQQQHPPPQMLPPQMTPGAGLPYPQMSPMANSAYSGMNRGMYQQGSNPQQYSLAGTGSGQQSSQGQQHSQQQQQPGQQNPHPQQQQHQQQQHQQHQGQPPNMPGWSGSSSGGGMHQDWPRYS